MAEVQKENFATYENPNTRPVEGPVMVDNNDTPKTGKRNLVIAVVAVFLVMALGLFTAYYFVFRQVASGEQGEQQAAEREEYENPRGFKFSYPAGTEVSEEDNSVSLSGSVEATFSVYDMNEPLSVIVDEMVETFSDSSDTSLHAMTTIDSRTGFRLSYQGREYYYFPLAGDYYLEVVGEQASEEWGELISSLRFTPPQNALN